MAYITVNVAVVVSGFSGKYTFMHFQVLFPPFMTYEDNS